MIAPECFRVVTSQRRSRVYYDGRNRYGFQGQSNVYAGRIPSQWGYGQKSSAKINNNVLQTISRFQNHSDLNDIFKSNLKITDADQRLLSCDSGIGGSEKSYFDCDDEASIESYRANSASEFSGVSSNCRSSPNVNTIIEDDFPMDSTLLPWEIPGLAQQLAIIQQAEYYFSDDYLSRDAYFLRQIRRKKEGFLSMKLITNFKKIRRLVKDPRITAYCLRKSKTLQVNKAGTKVKRINDVPNDLRRFQPQNSVLVIGIPERLAKIESVMNIFYKCGEMSSVRLIRPGKDCPSEILEHLDKRNDRTIRTKVNAVIEYEKSASAVAACRMLTNPRNSHGIEKVCLLACESKSKPFQQRPSRNWHSEAKSRRENFVKTKERCDWGQASANTRETPLASSDLIEKEENKSDNAWIREVVNHVLQQSSKTLSDQGIETSCSESDSENKPGNNGYSKLHSDFNTDSAKPRFRS